MIIVVLLTFISIYNKFIIDRRRKYCALQLAWIDKYLGLNHNNFIHFSFGSLFMFHIHAQDGMFLNFSVSVQPSFESITVKF